MPPRRKRRTPVARSGSRTKSRHQAHKEWQTMKQSLVRHSPCLEQCQLYSWWEILWMSPLSGDVPSLLLILGMTKLGCSQAAATTAKERCHLSRFQPSLFLSLSLFPLPIFLFSHRSFHLTRNKVILCTGLGLIQVFAQAKERTPVAGGDR